MEEKRGDRIVKIASGVILIVIFIFILKELQTILLPFFVAVIIAFLFEPFYKWMRIKRIPGFLAIIIIIIILLVLANVMSLFVFTSINSFQAEVPAYQQKFTNFYNSTVQAIESNALFQQYLKPNMDVPNLISGINIAGILENLVGGTVAIFGNFFLILIYVVFLMSEIGSLRKRLKMAYSIERARKIADVVEDVFEDMKKFIVRKTLINFSHAVLVYIILVIFGVDFAIVWAFLTFFMAFIPNVGMILATILPFVTALIQFESFALPAVILIILIVAGFIIGNILEPKIFGSSLNLSPILILLALIFWGYVWGVVGMLLSVPILSMIKIILSKFESTAPVAILMSHKVKPEFTVPEKKPKQMSLFQIFKKDKTTKQSEEK
ncbi:MAG: AI-2E family transporter [Ignavibacteria bacterium]|nr:AI-2E family transporter [Ignavibacteria bacterium]